MELVRQLARRLVARAPSPALAADRFEMFGMPQSPRLAPVTPNLELSKQRMSK